MLKMSRLTDYGTNVLAYLAGAGEAVHSANAVAEHTGLSPATVSKVLKLLARAGLVNAHRGAQGGYALARPAEDISASDVIDALEGPLALTECAQVAGSCELESTCLVGGAWQSINVAIRRALSDISLAELATLEAGQPPRIDLRAMVATPGRTARLAQD